MKPIAIIPARYASTRFPGKPLALIQGKPMIQHVYERCSQVFDLVFVATDNHEIKKCVEDFSGRVVMTSSLHTSGTDRCAEAAQIIAQQHNFDAVVNVQGDEPFIQTEQLQTLISCFEDHETEIATLISPINSSKTLFDSNKVKAVITTTDFALYFSRSAIPFLRDIEKEAWIEHHNYFLHHGLYAYKKNILQKLTALKETDLEKSEKLEQLRWLENGFKIKTAITNHESFGVDTPQDLANINKTTN